jgi:hypothetical protein
VKSSFKKLPKIAEVFCFTKQSQRGLMNLKKMKYVLQKEINGVMTSIELNADEVRAIGEYYKGELLEERVWLKLEFEQGVNPEDFKKFKGIVADILAAYEKNREYGCDDDFSMNEAFDEHSYRIENLLQEL